MLKSDDTWITKIHWGQTKHPRVCLILNMFPPRDFKSCAKFPCLQYLQPERLPWGHVLSKTDCKRFWIEVSPKFSTAGAELKAWAGKPHVRARDVYGLAVDVIKAWWVKQNPQTSANIFLRRGELGGASIWLWIFYLLSVSGHNRFIGSLFCTFSSIFHVNGHLLGLLFLVTPIFRKQVLHLGCERDHIFGVWKTCTIY